MVNGVADDGTDAGMMIVKTSDWQTQMWRIKVMVNSFFLE